MPRGPNGERRPVDLNQRVAMIVRIATGEIEEDMPVAAKRNGGRSEHLPPACHQKPTSP